MGESAGNIRAGRAFVEVGGEDSGLRKVLAGSLKGVTVWGDAIGAVASKLSSSLRAVGEGFTEVGEKLREIGANVGGIGLGVAAGLGAGVKAFSTFEDAMASLKANAKPTAAELAKIESAVSTIGKATGTGPAQVASAFSELLKAGLPLEKVLGGVAEATLKFAKVAEIDAAEAATVLTDAMNVFKVDATTAVDTLSRAADASSISLQDVTQSFSQVSAVAKLAGLSIGETATAIAILGNAGIKGSDAGTSLKTMLQRLQAPADEGAKAIQQYGIQVRDANQHMKPMQAIVAELQARLGGLNDAAKDEALKDIFGSDAIRAGSVLMSAGAKGFAEFTGKMQEGLPVAEKFAVLMDTLSGFGQKAQAAFERLGVEVGAILAPSIREAAQQVASFVDGVTATVKRNPQIITDLARLATGAIGLGAGLVAVGTALTGVGGALSFVSTPLGAITAALGVGGAAWLKYTAGGARAIAEFLPTILDMRDTALQAFAAIRDALGAGDLAKAGKIAWAALRVEFLTGKKYLMGVFDDLKDSLKEAMSKAGFEGERIFVKAFAEVRKEWASICSDMEGGFASSVARMAATLVNFVSPLAGILGKVLGIDVQKEVEKALRMAGLDEAPEHKEERLKDLKKEEDRIDVKKDEALAGVDDREDEHKVLVKEDKLMRGPDAKTRELARQLREARAELAAMMRPVAEPAAAAQGQAPAKETAWEERRRKFAKFYAKYPDGVGPSYEGSIIGNAGRPEARDLKGRLKKRRWANVADTWMESGGMEPVHRGIAAAAAKVDVQGSFNASTVGRMGAGTSVSSLLQKQIDATEKVEKKLDKINRTIAASGVFV